MKKYHISSGVAGIYAGILKNDYEWKDKDDCTDEAINSVRDYMVDDCLGGLINPTKTTGGYQWKLKDGRTVVLSISIKKDNE